MAEPLRHWRCEDDAGGVAWLHIDVANRSTNVLSSAVFDELEGLLDALETDTPRGVVFVSDKPNGFLAGADVHEFTDLDGQDAALRLVHRGQRIMDRIEALACPTVAVVHGFCMGGGTELALACDYRVALDDTATRLGLPEVRLGIHPGYGGTLRSIRTLGVLRAMDLMLTGRSLSARAARKIALVDHVVPERFLRTAASALVRERPLQARPGWLHQMAGSPFLRPLVAAALRRQVRRKAAKAHYPAPYALIDLWEGSWGDDRRMLHEEAESVAWLSTTPTARNLVRLYLLQDRLKSQAARKGSEARHVHVIGAGVMGGDIAAWCALQGCRVSLQDTDTARLGTALKRARSLYDRRLKSRRLVTGVMDRLIPDPDGAGMGRADVIVEAIFEDLEAKRDLFRAIEPRTRADALIATNTSTIPLEELARVLEAPGRLVGLHFFNPVARMPLLEVIRHGGTREEALVSALAFARQIDKLPLGVRSSPGFLVNRVLMPYLLEAVTLEAGGVPGVIIDRAATDFGMPMGPMELADTVGLDIALHGAEVLSRSFDFTVPERLRQFVKEGRLGKKSGRGYYLYASGRPVKPKKVHFAGDLAEVKDRLVLRLVNESLACLREGVVDDADLVDAGVVFGTGFAPFRGGPLQYLETEGRDRLRRRMEALQSRYGDRFTPDPSW